MNNGHARTGTNLLAGIFSSLWIAAVNLAAVPFYLRFLGIESYGLIGFFVTIQGLLLLLDLGIAPAINREIARCSASGEMVEAKNLLHTLEYLYWFTSILIALLIYFLSSFIGDYWLQAESLSRQTVVMAVNLMGVVVACRWPIGLYQGALMGAQNLALSSYVNVAMVSLANFGAIAILAYVSATVEAFFIWQAIVGLIHALTMKSATWKIVGKEPSVTFDIGGLKRIWQFSAGMSAIAVSSLVLTQLDKLLLSKILGLTEFAHFMLGVVIARSVYVFITPLFNVMYPKFSQYVVRNEIEQLILLYRRGTHCLAVFLFPLTFLIVFFAEQIIYLWTGNTEIAINVAPITKLLIIGSAFHGVMYFPYALQLAYGKTWIPLLINTVFVIIMIPLIIVLTRFYQALGGAIAWAILEFLYFIVGTLLTRKYILSGFTGSWLIKDIGIPFCCSVGIAWAGSYVIVNCFENPLTVLILGICLATSTCVGMIYLSLELRELARTLILQIMNKSTGNIV